MASEANEPGSESGKRSDDRRGAARGTRAGCWSPQAGPWRASRTLAAALPRDAGLRVRAPGDDAQPKPSVVPLQWFRIHDREQIGRLMEQDHGGREHEALAA